MMLPPVFTIASDLPFLDALVAGLLARGGADPLALAQHTILLPTRRSARALAEAFLRGGAGRPMLLPRLVPVGDVDAEELLLRGDDVEIPPAIPELRRQLLLTRLVQGWGRARGSGPLTAAQAAPLARELARFLDEVQTAGCDLGALAQLVPAEHAEHWQQSLAFLDILRAQWPHILAGSGCIDPAERRNRVLGSQIAAWGREPPAQPVIAAGLTGGVTAVADLVAAVARLPQGAVVLAGIDPTIEDESWAAIAADPAHSLHLTAQLLDRLEIAPAAVRPWPSPGFTSQRAARQRLVAESLRPAAESHRWRRLEGLSPTALRGLTRLDCPGPREEASAIALRLRQQLERPGATAALVTPDRGLARRVAAELKRWGIEIDDSAGVPLALTAPGVFLRLLLEALATELAPLPLLALLKHPLAAGGQSPEVFRATARRLELGVLRGPRPAPGPQGLRAVLPRGDAALARFLEALLAILAPLLELITARAVPLVRLVQAHIAAAEALAASTDESGATRLWRGDAGEAAAEFLDELLRAAPEFDALDGHDYPPLFQALVAASVVRPHYGRHPRLAIWGWLEARLQQADLLILGGLNEGTWPPETESDPWLSRPMRREFGLPPPERRIGAAAHDFAQALGAAEVLMTRAARVEGTPTVPSRWLLRLDTVLRSAGLAESLDTASQMLAWEAGLDKPARRLVLRPPEPRPPVALRPRRLGVTQIETWMRDPYALYARAILALKALEPIDADPGAAERGMFIHQALDHFLRQFPGRLPEDAERRLVAIGADTFGAALARPSVRAFWWPRFCRIARWFVAAEAERRRLLAEVQGEIAGSLSLMGPAGAFELVAKADRIDRRHDGGLVIIDYKTGAVPSPGDVELGLSPQLPLEAAIAAAGGFAAIGAGVVSELAYWRLSGGNPPGEPTFLGKDETGIAALAAAARAGLAALIAEFDDPRTPYRAVPWPEKAPRYSDYAHLARVKEWSVTGENGE